MTQNTLDYLTAHHDQILAELVEFTAIPSVSTDPAYAEGMDRAADWVADQLRRAGIEGVRMIPTPRHPVVYGEWLHAIDAPTILVYGHYDVQPPDPLDKWQTEPFQPTVREGRLYARGVSDDKGPMLIPLKVAEAFMATEGKLPINIKFMFEGEEEIGSPSLEGFITEHAEMLAADFALSADGAMWRINEPSITVASRGMTGLEFTLTGATKDLHSGRHGGAVANPLHAIAELVASLHTADGRVAVAGFYDDVLALSAPRNGRPWPPCPSTMPAIWPKWARRPPLARRATPPWNAIGPGPPWRSTACGAAIRARGARRSFPARPTPKSPAAWWRTRTRLTSKPRSWPICQAHTPPGVTLTLHADKHDALPYQIPADHPGLARGGSGAAGGLQSRSRCGCAWAAPCRSASCSCASWASTPSSSPSPPRTRTSTPPTSSSASTGCTKGWRPGRPIGARWAENRTLI